MTTKTRAKTRRIELGWVDHEAELHDHLIAQGWSERETLYALGVISSYRLGQDPNDFVSAPTMARLRGALKDVPVPSGQPPRIGRQTKPGSNETGRARLRLVGAIAGISSLALAPGAVASSTTPLLGNSSADVTCSMCPLQIEGDLGELGVFYFRARHDKTRLTVGADLHAAVTANVDDDGWVAWWDHDNWTNRAQVIEAISDHLSHYFRNGGGR